MEPTTTIKLGQNLDKEFLFKIPSSDNKQIIKI
jgi:hypothetical protein